MHQFSEQLPCAIETPKHEGPFPGLSNPIPSPGSTLLLLEKKMGHLETNLLRTKQIEKRTRVSPSLDQSKDPWTRKSPLGFILTTEMTALLLRDTDLEVGHRIVSRSEKMKSWGQ